MRPTGLTQLEIKKIIEFEWNDSADEDNEDDEDYDGVNLENVIEETFQNAIKKGDEIDINFLERIVEEEEAEDESVAEQTVQEVFEKNNLDSLRWRSTGLNVCDTAWKNEMVCGEVKDPINYFSHFIDDAIIQKICDETNAYALQTKGLELKCETTETRRFLGVLLYLGVINIPHMRMAWASNFKLSAVAQSLSRNRFEKIKEFFHINDNSQQAQRGEPNFGKLYKIRPLLEKMKQKCNEIDHEEHQSIDEQMITYKGRHSLKQYLPKKPHKWGFKMFTRAGVSGIIYDFSLYVGEGTCPSLGLGISSDIVLHLASNIPVNKNFKLFFDNWFSSISLMIALKEKGILAVGTIRSNRLKNCHLTNEKDLVKKGRGSCDFKYETTHSIIACRWYDNKSVQLVSNYIAENPISECKRWCRKEKKYISIPRPAIVECYNKHMGGVDLADMLVELYKINHRSKKWYMRIVYWCINTAVVNSWLLYRRDIKNARGETKHMPLLNFQMEIANELLNASKYVPTPTNPRKRGRPSSLLSNMQSGASSPASSSQPPSSPEVSSAPSSPCSSRVMSKRSYIAEPPKATRHDQTSHWIEWGTKGRCRLCHTGFPRSKCTKCNVFLCSNPQKNCFVSYHT